MNTTPPNSIPQTEDDQRNQKSVKRSIKDAIAGAAAGAISKSIIAPVERIKLVMQLRFSIENTTTKSSSSRKLPTTAWGVATAIYKDEGFFAFWRGRGLFFFYSCKKHFFVDNGCSYCWSFVFLKSFSHCHLQKRTLNRLNKKGIHQMFFVRVVELH